MNPCVRNKCSWLYRWVICFFTGCDEWNDILNRLEKIYWESRKQVNF